MNNKGQALVFIVVIIPIIITIMMGVVEFATITYQKTKITSNIKTVISSCYSKCNNEQIEKLFKKNNIEYETLEIKRNNNLEINIEVKINSMLGNIINKEYYLLNIDLIGKMDNKKLVIKKG